MFVVIDKFTGSFLMFIDVNTAIHNFLSSIYAKVFNNICLIEYIQLIHQDPDTNIVYDVYAYDVYKKCIINTNNEVVDIDDIPQKVNHNKKFLNLINRQLDYKFNEQSMPNTNNFCYTQHNEDIDIKQSTHQPLCQPLFDQSYQPSFDQLSCPSSHSSQSSQHQPSEPLLNQSPIQSPQQQSNQTQLEEKIKQINNFITLSKYDLEKRKQEFDDEKMKLVKEYEKINNEKIKLKRAKEKEEEKLRVFNDGKNIYYQIKRKLMCGEINDIPEMFIRRYNIYRELENEALLNIDGEYNKYLEKEMEAKNKQYLEDKKQFYSDMEKINKNELNINTLEPEYRCKYDVFKVLDEMEILDKCSFEEEYKTFLESYADLLDAYKTAKYGLDTIDYLQDCDTGTVIKLVENDVQKENSILNSSIAKTLNVCLESDKITKNI